MAQKDLRVNLSAETRSLERGMQRGERAMERYRRSVEDANSAMMRLEQELQRDIDKTLAEVEARSARAAESAQRLGTGMMVAGGAIAAGLGLAARAAVQWESDWAGVTKTVEGSDAQMQALEDSLRGLALQIPATHTELAQIAESAGQLGVQTENVIGFTRTIAAMGVTTNMTVEDAAKQMARFSNIMGTPQQDIDRLGASIVELGNNSATTEAEILEMAMRIAGAGNTVGMTEGDVLGFAAALSSVGVEAEAGGSAVSRVMLNIDTAVAESGENLTRFAQVAGTSADEFTETWRDDPSQAIAQFVSGLDEMNTSGENVAATLAELGLGEIVVRDALLRMAGASDVVAQSLELGNQGWEENTALLEEAAQRYETTESKVQIAQNSINEMGIALGEGLLPILGDAAQRVTDYGTAFSSLSETQQGWVTTVGGTVSALGLVTGALVAGGPKLLEWRENMQELATSGGTRMQRGLGATATFLTGPYGAAIGGVMALGGLWLDQKARQIAAEQEWADALAETGGVIDASIAQLGARKLEETGLLELSKELGVQEGVLTQALIQEGEARKALATADQMAQLAKQGLLEEYSDERQSIKDLNAALEVLFGTGTTWRDLTDEQWQQIQNLNGGLAEQIETMDSATEAQAALALETEATTGQYMTAEEAADNYRDSVEQLTSSALDAVDAEIRWQEAVDAASDSIAANGATLDLNTEAGRSNQRALNEMVKSGNKHIAMMIESGASSKELRKAQEKMREQIRTAGSDMGASAEEAEGYADMLRDIPDNINTDIEVDAKGKWKVVGGFTISPSGETAAGSGGSQISLRAHGGPVFGPGTETSDSIPALLSNNEHVIPANEVRAAGGQQAIHAIRDLIRAGDLRFAGGGAVGDAAVQRYARGGSVLPKSARIVNDHREDTRIRLFRLIEATVDGMASEIGKQLKKHLESGGSVVRQATKWAGTPYSWGGGGIGGPSEGFGRGAGIRGFDCSSLMQYAWYHGTNGRVRIPRVTYDQINTGRAVPTGQQIPGDLVFPHRGHVGMYVGGGRLFHTFRTGDVAGYRSMYPSPLAIRRPGRFDDGGMMYPGEHGVNMTRRPERVLDPATTDAFDRLVDGLLSRPGGARGGDGAQVVEHTEYHIHHVPGYSTVQDLQRADERRQRSARIGRAR
ncbi:phage tail tape measure protein [Nocardiopsis gilva]|uniref:phage tail tape measure protein n=1 Tax=Nocardiopsis gilva TaxID=280236 RepID=UPI000344AD08|nr:phage tail tape measure protein [Nocardiopsis gilva]